MVDGRSASGAKSAGKWLFAVLCGCAIVLIAVVLLSNALFTGKPGARPPARVTDLEQLHQLDQLGSYLSAALASVDQLVSMLTTVQLSLFVLVGVGRGKALRGDRRPSVAEIVAGVFFVIFAFASLTLGYAARMQMAKLIELATASFDSVRETVVSQAISVTLSGTAAVCMLIIPFVEIAHHNSRYQVKVASSKDHRMDNSGRTETIKEGGT